MNAARTIFRWTLPLVAIGVLAWPVIVPAQEAGPRAERRPTGEAPAVVRATVEGTNICLGCTLKKQKGAAAQCSIFGHKHVLKVTKAVQEDSRELRRMRGAVLHYLETQKSQELIKSHHGGKLTITGKVYPLERVLEVESFKKAATPEK